MTDLATKRANGGTAAGSGTTALTVSAAARSTALDRRTIRRHLTAGHFPGAYREPGPTGSPNGPWRIPVEDLRGAGLLPGGPAPKTAPEPAAPPNARSELARLRTELAEAVRRAETAEAAVWERDQLIQAQREALAAADRGDGGSTLRRTSFREGASEAPEVTPSETSDDGSSSLDHSDGSQLPLFASSWASVPPWDHAPVINPPQERRWWRRLANARTRAGVVDSPVDQRDQR